MRFSKLKVENFKAITSAEVEFGSGLNVLYGPNDLGKSTLGQALKAVLLLQPNSALASEYLPWHEAVAPVVSLTFQDDEDRYWRVAKRFTENVASLAFSRDGREFNADVNERAVDEKLRKLLGWGIPAPGGKGGPRGMPESFLANALLAAQTDVEKILRVSLEDDPDQTGKLKLTKALSALAQDPLVRHVLDGAQAEYERYYTATGRRRGGQSAPLTLASDAVKKLTDELMEKQHALEQSTTTEFEVKRLHEAWLVAQHHEQDVTQRLVSARAGLAKATEKRAAEAKHASEAQALAHLDVLAAQVKALEVEFAALDRQVKQLEGVLAQAQQGVKTATAALREAEDGLRKATSADGEAERAVARANAEAEVARQTSARGELAGRLERARARKALQAEQERLTKLLGPAKEQLRAAEADAALIGGIIHYGAWRMASDAAVQAEQWRADAQRTRADALKKTSEQLALQQKTKSLEDEVSRRRSSFPDDKQLAAFAKLRNDLELAEAALGGGVTVTVRPKSALLLTSTTDESPAEETKTAKELVLEANRRVQLSIGDLIEIEVVTGAAEKRKDADRLRKRWKAEVAPLLERADVGSLSELQEQVRELSERLDEAKQWKAQILVLDGEIASLRSRAGMLDEKAAGAPSPAQLEEKERQIGPLDRALLEQAFVGMKDWEAETRPQFQQVMKALERVRAEVGEFEGKLTLTAHRLADAGDVSEDVVALEKTLAALNASLAAAQARLTQMTQERGGAVAEATQRFELAKRQLAKAEQVVISTDEALTRARAAASAKQGERDAIDAQVKQSNRAALVDRVEAAKKKLEAYAEVEVLSDDELARRARLAETARTAAEQAGRDYAAAEGALSRVGGPQAREQVRQLEEALSVARAQEHHLEVDAAAWRLLMEAVRASEKEDSASLGSALAVPVTSRFAELTKGRYPQVQFEPSLRAGAIQVQGVLDAPDVLGGLSVGTRDHLATLVRLAIALQLKSAIVLDDHLVHTDLGRLAWFRDALHEAAKETQVLVLTCRPFDYVPEGQAAPPDTKLIDLTKLIKRR
jgi:hypothetical protein